MEVRIDLFFGEGGMAFEGSATAVGKIIHGTNQAGLGCRPAEAVRAARRSDAGGCE
jgi:hypothetical protein